MKLAVAVLAAGLFATPLSAATLDFSGAICSGSVCSSGSLIDPGYGSTPNVTVVYNRDVNGTSSDPRLVYWESNYSGLTGVAYGGSSNTNGRPEIFFDPAPGFEVTVISFQLGAYLSDRTTQVSVLTGGGGVLFESDPNIAILNSTASTFSPATTDTGPWTSGDGIRIQWGPNGWNVGIDNIEFSVQQAGAPGVIPLPAPIWLLATGLLALAGVGQARRRA